MRSPSSRRKHAPYPIHLESIECLCWGSGRCPGEQAEMSEDLGDHRGFFDGGDDLQGAAATQGQCSLSIANTRLSSRAQLMRVGADGGGASPCSAEVSWVLSGAFGMISGRPPALCSLFCHNDDQSLKNESRWLLTWFNTSTASSLTSFGAKCA
jgi:hypothetical protein